MVNTYPQLTVKGVGFDRTLGGLEMDIRLRDHLAVLYPPPSFATLLGGESAPVTRERERESQTMRKSWSFFSNL